MGSAGTHGKRWRRPCARIYLFCLLTLVAIVPVGLLGAVQVQRWARIELLAADRTARAVADSVASQAAELAGASVRAVEALAEQLGPVGVQEPMRLQRLLAAYQKHYPEFSGWRVLAVDGDVVFGPGGSPSRALSEHFQYVRTTRKTRVFSASHGPLSSGSGWTVAVPILGIGGEFKGMVEGGLRLEHLLSPATRAPQALSQGRVIVFDASGRALADSAGEVTGDSAPSELFSGLSEASSREFSARITRDAQGKELRAVAVPVDFAQLGWTVLAYQEAKAVAAEVQRARGEAMAIAGGVLLLALLLAILSARHLSRPVRALAARAALLDVSEGSVQLPPLTQGPREFLELDEAIRAMVERLHSHTEELKGVVSRRTEQLSSVNEDLTVLATAMRHAGDSIEICDTRGRYIAVNPAFESMTGYTEEEVLGKTPVELLSEQSLSEEFLKDAAEQDHQGVFRGSYLGRRKDKSQFESEVVLTAVRSSEGLPSHWICVRRDLTELRQTEKALHVSDRLASVGTLAAGVAHELNNPLSYVASNLAYVREMLAAGAVRAEDVEEKLEPALRDAEEGISRVATIVSDLRTFARPDSGHQGPVNLKEVLESAIKMTRNEVRHRARMVCDFEPIPPVYGNASKLAQVFVNLIINAVQSLSEGHVLSNAITIRLRREQGSVQAAISDTGCGMTEESLVRAFDPFYTTKEVGLGTGLGLSICHNIVQSLGGRLTATSRVGEGSTFRVELPAVKEEKVVVSQRKYARAEDQREARILVIDDDRNVGRGLRRMLRNHAVELCTGGEQGLKAMEGGDYDIILCDLMMPDLTGMEIHELILTRRPEMAERMVFMTGGAFTPSAREFVDQDEVRLLHKPFDPDELEHRVQESLRSEGPESLPSKLQNRPA